MAGDLSRGGSPDTVPPIVAAYVADLEARIPGWRRARRSALAELADGLHDATTVYCSRGMDPEGAAARAVHDCGPPSVVAAEFVAVLTDGQARRTALTLLLTGPLVGVLWLVTLEPGQAPDATLRRMPALGVLVAVAAAAGVLALLATGPGIRGLPIECPAPCRAAATACAAAAAADVIVLATATLSALEQPSATRWMPGLIAGSASLVRFTLTQRVARRDLFSSPVGA